MLLAGLGSQGRMLSEFGWDAGLFADLVGRDAIELFVPLHRDRPVAVGVYGVAGAFPEQVEAVFLEMPNATKHR